MGIMAAIGIGMWLYLFGGSGSTGVVTSGLSKIEADDAAAVIERFGKPEEDKIVGADAPAAETGTRTLIYTSRGLRIVFAQREVGRPPARRWKLLGFSELDGQHLITGEEALRRLLAMSP